MEEVTVLEVEHNSVFLSHNSPVWLSILKAGHGIMVLRSF